MIECEFREFSVMPSCSARSGFSLSARRRGMIVVTMGLLVTLGCTGSLPPVAGGQSPLETALDLASEGKMDEACDVIMANGDDVLGVPSREVLRLSERQYMWRAIWDSERRGEFFEQMNQCAGDVKELSRALLAKSKQEASLGNSQRADDYQEAVRIIGRSIIKADLTIAVQQIGEGALYWADNL